ncbi:MAG: phosphatase PAP2 family protein [Chloroflexota bacterium]|nr:phosphatase PAP2 family protein [Chloroflexota bacterium]
MTNLVDVIVRQLDSGDVVLALVMALLSSFAIARVVQGVGGRAVAMWSERYAQLAWQLGALLGLEQAYEFTRGQIPHESDIAFINAYRVLDLEWSHGLFVEQRIEHYFLQFGTVMSAVDLFYIVAHVGVTIGVMAWLYTRRREHFPFLRNMLMVTTAIALVAFYVFPTAPPRLVTNYGFVDPVVLHHFVGPGGAQPGSYTYNPYAAMPSLHVAYAMVSAWSLFLAERQFFVRISAILYPFAMAAVVIISGNHWLLDVVGAAVTVLLAWIIVGVGTHGIAALRYWLLPSRSSGLVSGDQSA